MTQKESLVVALHESRDHARDGGELDGFLCNCREYVESLWPKIDALIHEPYAEGPWGNR